MSKSLLPTLDMHYFLCSDTSSGYSHCDVYIMELLFVRMYVRTFLTFYLSAYKSGKDAIRNWDELWDVGNLPPCEESNVERCLIDVEE